MARIGALLVLSREHHAALVVARAARHAGGNSDPALWSAAVAHVENHWHRSMAAHFDEEERLIRVAGNVLDSELVARILAEHEELRILALGACRLEPAERLRRFGELVSSHVRFEERVFFPQLELDPDIAAIVRTTDQPDPAPTHSYSIQGDDAA